MCKYVCAIRSNLTSRPHRFQELLAAGPQPPHFSYSCSAHIDPHVQHALRQPEGDQKFGAFVTRLLPLHSTLNVASENDTHSGKLAGAAGFEPAAFGFGDHTRGVYSRPRISPNLHILHGWRDRQIPNDPKDPVGSRGFCYPVVARAARGPSAAHDPSSRRTPRSLHGDRVPAVRSRPTATPAGASRNPRSAWRLGGLHANEENRVSHRSPLPPGPRRELHRCSKTVRRSRSPRSRAPAVTPAHRRPADRPAHLHSGAEAVDRRGVAPTNFRPSSF